MTGTNGRRILIDGTMAQGGGGFTYLVNVLPRLSALAPDDRFLLLLRSERLARALPALPNVDVELLPLSSWSGRLRFVYGQAAHRAKQWGADLYFSAGEQAPPNAHCPVIASFRNPNVFTRIDQGWPFKQRLRLAALRTVARLSAWTADRILFVSADSARWIGDVLRLPERKRAVVHHGIDATQWRRSAEPASGAEQPWPYILSVSSVYRYKNFVRLIEAYAALARRRPELPDLLVIGDDQDPEYSQKMRAARAATGELADRIHLLGEVPYSAIRSYYAGAALFVFPSYLETFGHPLLEAMASELPVVAADIPVFREIGADAAFYADPHDSEALASAMEEALFSARAREALVKRGAERVRAFTWERSARGLSTLFQGVLAERAAVRVPAIAGTSFARSA